MPSVVSNRLCSRLLKTDFCIEFQSQMTPVDSKSMKLFWIVGRFVVGSTVALGVLLSLGWNPAPQIGEGTQSPGALNSTQDTVDDEDLSPETLVTDWPKPAFALFVTGRQHGYIEPCGCITLERQKGGLMRRHRVQMTLRKRGWDLVSIDAGNQVRRSFAQQPLYKFAATLTGLVKKMKYDMIGVGPDDMNLPALDVAQNFDSALVDKNPFTCANVVVMDQQFTNQFVVTERSGMKVGMTMVVGDEYLGKFKNASPDDLSYSVTPVRTALNSVVPKLNAAKCNFKVLVAFAGLEECRKLAREYPMFDLVVTAGGAGDPTMQPEMVATNAGKSIPMIQVGVKGMYVGLVGVYNQNGKIQIRYKRVPLTHKFEDTEPMKKVFLDYQNQLKSLWLAGQLNDIKPRLHPSGHKFVGSAACADCHDEEYAIWEDGVDGDGGPHPEATDSLRQNPNDDRVWVQRHFDPECMSCHATGWNAQNFYPYQTGLVDLKQEHLYGNGCENCHGPGSAHIQMEEQAARGPVDEALLTKLRNEMVVTLAQAKANACKECHDLDNSPDFLKEGGFEKYWPKIEHGGDE